MWRRTPRRGGEVLASTKQGMRHQWKWAGRVELLMYILYIFQLLVVVQASSCEAVQMSMKRTNLSAGVSSHVCHVRRVCLTSLSVRFVSRVFLTGLSELCVQQHNHGGRLVGACVQVHEGDGRPGWRTLQPRLANCWGGTANLRPSKTGGGRQFGILYCSGVFISHLRYQHDPSFQCYQCDSSHENCSENEMGEAVFCGDEMNGCLITRGSCQTYTWCRIAILIFNSRGSSQSYLMLWNCITDINTYNLLVFASRISFF